MTDHPPPSRRLSQADAARRLEVSPRTLQRYQRQGIGPAFTRLGPRRLFYVAADIDRWLHAQRRGAPA